MKEIRKTLGDWAFDQNIRLLDEKYYNDTNLYTLEEYTKIVPRNIEVPLNLENNEIKPNSLISLVNDEAILNPEVSLKIAEFEKTIKELKEKEDELKQSILNEMESKNILKLETDDLMINYIAASERETLDSKKLREEQPDLYDEYVKFSPVKASIRLKVK